MWQNYFPTAQLCHICLLHHPFDCFVQGLTHFGLGVAYYLTARLSLAYLSVCLLRRSSLLEPRPGPGDGPTVKAEGQGKHISVFSYFGRLFWTRYKALCVGWISHQVTKMAMMRLKYEGMAQIKQLKEGGQVCTLSPGIGCNSGLK